MDDPYSYSYFGGLSKHLRQSHHTHPFTFDQVLQPRGDGFLGGGFYPSRWVFPSLESWNGALFTQ
jgi:hypothetical protein